ncbi:uncharacterized protein SEPMUDRAFT_142183 [Sphaerulina musiva SO2202]|uniref:Rhodopsin domain-containing protein n=1 Tax=Sphaerulina musiva (strain SO2202) TaxID=692275 RepID=N1QFB9_SPHMS|nr:uncharacterized protein SEPMUDRAFT_142183 [Sphaerulina musiva SO2202]EMF11983.1 hypothetical protein SEPMUDRAFT_142183 [Sphaerulina musiva SO2202]
MTSVATVVVGLRCYTRCRISHCFGLDDYAIMFALVALIARFILSCNCVWTVTVSVTKASILAQYLRIFDARYTRALCYFMLFLLVPAVAWGIFAGIFLCTPTAKLWNPSLAGHCRSAKSYWLSVAAIDIFLDFAVLVLPMPSIASLHLPRKQKLATIGMFTLGFLVCFVSVARIASVVISSDQGDHVMSGLWAIIWSSVEANVGISCACLLSLKALLTKLFPRLLWRLGSGHLEPVWDELDHKADSGKQREAAMDMVAGSDFMCWVRAGSRLQQQ